MYHGNLGQSRPLQPVRCLLPAHYIFCLEYVMMLLFNVYSTLLYCWMFIGPVNFAQGLEFQYHATFYIRSKYLISKLAGEI